MTVVVVLDENPANLFDILCWFFLKDYGCSWILNPGWCDLLARKFQEGGSLHKDFELPFYSHLKLKVIISSVYVTIDHGTSSVVASPSCLVELLLSILCAMFTVVFAF